MRIQRFRDSEISSNQHAVLLMSYKHANTMQDVTGYPFCASFIKGIP